MSAPVGWNTHVGEGDIGVFVKQGEESALPECGRADFAQPEVADSQHQPNTIGRKAGCNVPVGVLPLAGDGGLDAKSAIPDAGVMGTCVAQGEDGFGPGEELLIREAKSGGSLLDQGMTHAISQLQCCLARHEFARHPEREVFVPVAVKLIEVFNEGLTGAVLFIAEFSKPELVFSPLNASEPQEGFQVAPAATRGGQALDAGEVFFEQIAE